MTSEHATAPVSSAARPAAGSLDDALFAERERLVRLCARLTGDADAAEDLAQEALLEGWRHLERLYGATLWKAYLTGIARNVCLRWHRKRSRERERWRVDAPAGLEHLADYTPMAHVGGEWSDEPVEDVLMRSELSSLLDRAMAALPGDAREMLTERYVDGLSQAEIAARRRMTEGCAGVRLHRSRGALRRVLETRPELRADAAAYGLLDADALEGWQETRLWCPACGAAFLECRFDRDARGRCTYFAVRCEVCRDDLGVDFTTGFGAIDPAALLSDVKGCKPALNRLNQWWGDFMERGVATGASLCGKCGGETTVTTDPPDSVPAWLRDLRGVYSICARCRRPMCLTAEGRAFHTPEARAFWRRNPRMRIRDGRDLSYAGRAAVSVTMESVTDSATLDVVLSRDTFAVLNPGEN